MKPIQFTCRETLGMPPEDIAAMILDLSLWPRFQGYGPLPGIREAEFETRTPETVGTRIRVHSTDGSTHIEEILEWEPSQTITLKMHEFSVPVSRLATSFLEVWQFHPTESGTEVTRTFEMYPKSRFTRPTLYVISRLLKKAIAKNLRDMQLLATETS